MILMAVSLGRVIIALLDRGAVIHRGAKPSVSVSRGFLTKLQTAFVKNTLIMELYYGTTEKFGTIFYPKAFLRENSAAIIAQHLRRADVRVSQDEMRFIIDFVVPLFRPTLRGENTNWDSPWSDKVKSDLVCFQASSVVDLANRYLRTR
jgi:hypothetical protein